MLTVTKIRSAKACETPYKLADGGGLTLLVKPNGAKLWRFRYRFQGRENMLAVGSYPDTDLALARDNRDEARKLLARGIDPSAKLSEAKQAKGNSFEEIAREWMQKQKLAEVTIAKAKWILETFVYPSIGQRPISEVTASEILRVLRSIESKGFHETAHRARQRISQVLRYATATGRADRDVTHDLRGALTAVPTKHRAAIIDPKKVGELLRAITDSRGKDENVGATHRAIGNAGGCLVERTSTADELQQVFVSRFAHPGSMSIRCGNRRCASAVGFQQG